MGGSRGTMEVRIIPPCKDIFAVVETILSPHPSSAELICSTSNQKLLIWNLRLSSQNAVQQILHGHYRAITDINWHPYNENIVGQCLLLCLNNGPFYI